jgi:uncharacterized repeat protein (TIGR01451 family)/fimbrial isopeptide formation D2 family protein/LPXTG-motif cell wall-anchored protein
VREPADELLDDLSRKRYPRLRVGLTADFSHAKITVAHSVLMVRSRKLSFRARKTRRLSAALTAASLVMLGAVVLPLSPANAAGSPGIALAKTAPASVLAGKPISFTLTASNPSANVSAAPEYNASFRDVLPLGLTYTPGSTTPADVGDPTIITNAGRQTLIWPDAFDLQVGATSAITFSAGVDNTVLPVGSTVLNTGNAYASTAPRYLPKFDATGAPVANVNVQPATSNQTSTSITALEITKAEPSPEAKLLRGVHDHPTIYTLTVTNTSRAATNAATVVDYLPAEEEFLGCGLVDNTAAGAVEYPGAPSLTATPAVGANCPTPVAVDTVANPPANGSVAYPAGIYTKLTWNLGTLTGGQIFTIRYAAGIPLRQNVLFAGGPSAASLGQVANLDNNTGASTRQINVAASQINYAHVAGTYTGPVIGGVTSVFADTTHTVTVNDLRIYKSVSPVEFVAGAVANYTLHVDSGEYTDNSAITITDVLPNGVCPLDDAANYVTGAPAECNSGAGFAPSLPFQSVTQNADGTFTVVFQPIAVAKDGSTVITYSGRDRTVYTGGALAGEPIAAGDSFTNFASEQGTSTPIAATGFTGAQPVRDATSATQTTSLGALSKTIGARATPMTCSSATYGTTTPTFVKGDRVCFQITVPFSSANQTRNAVVTDFLPSNTSYELGSVSYPASNTVDLAQINFDTAGAAAGQLSWKVGATTGDGSTEVPVGEVFVAQFSALILDAAAGPAPDKPGNIVKLLTTNSAGAAQSLRDGVDFNITAAPPIGLTKGIASVNGGTANPANTDHVAVREGDSVVFRVDATNNGSAGNGNNVPITGMTLWDVLPAGITCAMLSAVSDAGTCTNPGDGGQPSFTGNGTRSAIVWTYATSLAPAASKTFNYTVAIPAGVSVSADLVNTAAVRSYTVGNDTPGTTTYFPAANIDTTVSAASYDAPATTDNSDVYLRDVAVAKGVASAVNEAGNVGAEGAPASSTQATPGEQVTFTATATIPAHSTVFNAAFADPIPAGLTLNSAVGTYRPDSGSATTAALPAGVTFTATAPPTFSFPATYDNTTGTDQVFTMTIVVTLTHLASDPLTRSNTASFTSQTALTGGTAVPPRTATATVADVEPAPTLTKTNNSGGPVSGGQTITYTVKPTNAAGRPPLHDGWQLDCLPNGLTFGAYGAPPGGVTTSPAVAGTGANGCPSGYTVLAWNLGDLAGGTTLTLTYTATVDPGSSGKSSFTNVASVSGNSLAQTRTSPTDPGNPSGRQYSASANSTVNIAGATAVKSVTPGSATVGDTATYTTSAVLPAGVTFYNLSLIDQVPNGIDPNSIVEGPVTCTNADTTACSLNSASPLTPVAGPASSTIIGWLIGDASFSAQVRTVSVKYTAKVKDNAAAVAGAGLVNQLHVAWNTAAGSPPTSAGNTFNQASPTVTATLTVLEPGLSTAKSVNNSTPEPGQTFGYTLTVTNANTPSTSVAYNVTVTDTVPTGVLVDPASISGGGTISGQSGTGGGTISWTLAGSIAKNTGTTFTYSAQLAPSGGLGTAGLANTAKVTGYDSLPTGGRHYTGGSATATVTPKFPKMTTTKSTPNGTTAVIGSSFTWKVTAKNTGAGAAYQVATLDTLPANWTYDAGSAQVSVNGGPPSQVEPTVVTSSGVQSLTWTGLGNLAAGTSLTIVYTATPQPSVFGAPGVGLSVNQTNTATSNAQDATGATGNSAGSYASTPGTAVAHIVAADLKLTKAVGTAPVAGQPGSWKLIVANNGPDTASGPFTVTEPFNNPAPSGVSNIVASGTGWSCTTATPINCVRTNAADTLATGASFPVITVTYDVDSGVAAGTVLSNSASVSSPTADPAPGNNTGTASAAVTASADLAISKTLSSAQLVAGASVSYSLAVTNLGPSAAAGPITVNDPLPAGTTFVSVSGTGWTCDPITAGAVGATVHCTLAGPLMVGATPAAITVTVGVPSSQTTAVSNTATASSPTTDPVPGNNSSTVNTTPTTQADLSIQKRHLTSPFVAGQTADYQIDVHNAGESDAAGVEVADNLPIGLSYGSFSSTDPNWTCSAAGAHVSCTYTGTLPAGTTSSIKLTVNLASDFTGPAVNTATVSSATTDPVPGNNSDTDNSSVNTIADLSIVKTDSGTATAGNALSYTLAVHDAGPSDVAGTVTVSDSLPAGLSYVSASGTGWACDYTAATRLISCTLAAGLVSGADATAITVATTVDSGVGVSTISNTASVSSDTTDPVLGNNSSTDPVNIVTSADISLTKVLTGTTPVIAGGHATFVLSASNSGPSDAAGVTVTDTLPANMSFVSFTGTGWDCIATGQDVVCGRDSIVAHTSAPDITLITLVSASTPVTLPAGTATLVNNASIDSSTPGTKTDPGPVDVPVKAQADLSLVKSPKNGTVIAGNTFTWNLAVHSAGPSDAAAPITVVDTLPGYQTYLSATGGWDCTADAAPAPPSATDHQTVTCTLSQGLAAGADAPALQLLVQVDDNAPAGTETNSATASSPTPGATGTDSAPVTVTRTAQLSITKVHTGNGVVGQDLPFTVRVHNAGPSIADLVQVVDPLPAGLTFVSAGGTGWTCAADASAVVTCTLAGTLGIGADASDITVTATVGAQAYPTVTNTATVSSADPDLPGSATASDPVTVDPSAVLHVVKAHVGTFVVGKTGSYLLTVSNGGPTATPGPVVVTDKLPVGVSYKGFAGDGWACVASGSTVTCTRAGAFAANASSTLTLVVNVLAAAYPSVTNTATATATGSPPATGNDTAPVTPTVDLGITKVLTSYKDNLASYRITVSNSGPNATVKPIVVTDKLQTGLSYRSATGTSWTCTDSANTVTCIRAAVLAAGASSSITLVALVNAAPGTKIVNVATVSGGGVAGTIGKTSPVGSAVLAVAATGSTGAGNGSLPQTGRDSRDLLVTAIATLLFGLGLLLLGRRRPTS